MRRLLLLTVLVLAGCAATPKPAPLQPAPTPTPTAQAVTFPAADGVSLHGKLFGHGTTTVVLSNMGDNDPAEWEAFAPLLAARGYSVLSYSFRYPAYTNSFTPTMAVQTVPDLTGAVAFARQRGAQRIVLIGASLGGITTGKLAAQLRATSVVIISAEQDLVGYGLACSPAELAAMTQPKLFIASQDDTNTAYSDTQSFFANAPPPKQFHLFPGDVHGVHLFDTVHGNELRDLLLTFVSSTAPVGS
jgi:pimeloyl-ACP methyl ester carboxylesterase